MLLELLIMLEIIAFLFLALGIYPFQKSYDMEGNENKPPYLNKILFCMIAGIIFGSLGLISINYDYNYCYTNQTVADYALNTTTATATCASYEIQSIELSYLNYSLALVSLVMAGIVGLFAATNKQHIGE